MEFEKDMLVDMFKIQVEQNNFWYDTDRFRIDKQYRMTVIKDYILGIYEQVTDVLGTFEWKKNSIDRVENINNSKEQLIDVLKYSMGLLAFMDINPVEIHDLFVGKSYVLKKRWEQQKLDLSEKVNVIIVDIDGCIANYTEGYENFLVNEIGLKQVNDDRLSYYFSDKFGITKQKEEQLHSQFIQSGGFTKLGVISESVDVIKSFKEMDIKIVLLTARPSWIYKRIFNDTYGWLDENKIEYDLLLFDKDKADAIINNVLPANILVVIEDRDKHAIEIAHLNTKVLMLDKEHNKGIKDSEYIKRVKNWAHIKKVVFDNYIIDKL